MGKNSAQSKPQTKNRYKGVRLRPSGKWSAEIRDPIEGRTWIGSYYTAEEACRAYDLHARRIGFPNAKLNFPDETPAPASQKGHPAKVENQEQPPQVSLENVQPNVNVVQQNSFNGFNSNPFDLDLPYDFVTANRNLEDTYYWSILHQEQNGPNALQQKNIVQEDFSNNLNNSVLDRDYLYSLIGSENIDLSVLGLAMEDGRNSTPAIPSVDSQPPEYSLPVGAGDLEESSGWSVFEMEMKNGPNTTNSNQKLKSNFIKAMPGAAEYDQRWREFDHPVNGDASEFVVESERSLEKKIEKQKPERENGKGRDGLEFADIFSESKDDEKMDKMKAREGRMKMEDEELQRKIDMIEERKVDIEERNVFLEQRRIAVDQERIKLQREKKEIDIMMMDVSTMNEVQKKYIESLQNEFFSRRMAM